MTINLEEIRSFTLPEYQHRQIDMMTDNELSSGHHTFVFDIECFPNYFLVAFKCVNTGKILFFEKDFDKRKLSWLLEHSLIIGFNSRDYDFPMLWGALQGLSTQRLHELSDTIIFREREHKFSIEKEFGFRVGFANHIDLQQVAPAAATFCSLKQYGSRMHVKRVQDLPIDPNQPLTDDEMIDIRSYCVNDLDITHTLYEKLKSAIDLRIEMGMNYGEDLRSLSDAQVAEKILSTEIASNTGKKPQVPRIAKGTVFSFHKHLYMQFYTPALQAMLKRIWETDFTIDENGKIIVKLEGGSMSGTSLWEVKIGQTTYRLGIGGLHSTEQKQTYFSGEEYTLFDRDVASYYPMIILNQGLYPAHIGTAFLDTYRDIVERRLKAKAAGDKTTAYSLKIAINGSFGKLGSKWSFLYAPELLLQVTLSGQLTLLMLIEMLEYCRIPVISANTDGIVVKCPVGRESDYLTVVSQWETITGFSTEETRYASLHSRDVNNYIAITEDGKIKAKGAYTNDLSFTDPDRESLMKNPNGTICSEAVMEFLISCNKPNPVTIDSVIKKCKDINKFIFTRKVKGGAHKDTAYLGKVVRWYMRKGEFGAIRYRQTDNIVSESVGSYPIMEINEFPKNLDYDWYIRRAHNILKDIGYYGGKNEQLELDF